MAPILFSSPKIIERSLFILSPICVRRLSHELVSSCPREPLMSIMTTIAVRNKTATMPQSLLPLAHHHAIPHRYLAVPSSTAYLALRHHLRIPCTPTHHLGTAFHSYKFLFKIKINFNYFNNIKYSFKYKNYINSINMLMFNTSSLTNRLRRHATESHYLEFKHGCPITIERS